MSLKKEYGLIARYHDQPPIETQACVWRHARSVSSDWTVEELFEWADKQNSLIDLTLTCRNINESSD